MLFSFQNTAEGRSDWSYIWMSRFEQGDVRWRIACGNCEKVDEFENEKLGKCATQIGDSVSELAR